jgi:hypothetical protein
MDLDVVNGNSVYTCHGTYGVFAYLFLETSVFRFLWRYHIVARVFALWFARVARCRFRGSYRRGSLSRLSVGPLFVALSSNHHCVSHEPFLLESERIQYLSVHD